jgi:hypothetical protein
MYSKLSTAYHTFLDIDCSKDYSSLCIYLRSVASCLMASNGQFWRENLKSHNGQFSLGPHFWNWHTMGALHLLNVTMALFRCHVSPVGEGPVLVRNSNVGATPKLF